MDTPIKTAVVTGGHNYDVPRFHDLFRAMPGVDAFIQHLDDFASAPEAVRDSYDVVLFYIMLRDGPTDEGLPFYQGQPKSALEHLGTTAQGIVVLHHGLLAYPDWPVWHAITGMTDRRLTSYHHDETLRVEVAAPAHPITAGLTGWTMVDESYRMADAPGDNHILLTVDHPRSMRTLAWTRQYRNSRVFCFQSGHDHQAWADPHYREVLRRGIGWCAGAI